MSGKNNAQVQVVLGAQWGDEGKGKLVDLLSQKVDICARCQGGNNAGHTIVVNDIKYDFHLLPSGLINPACKGFIGSGVVVHLPAIFEELEALKAKGLEGVEERLFISDRAHIVLELHQVVDGLKEGELGRGSIGTTRKGIGPTYSNKAARSGIRLHQLMAPDVEAFKAHFHRLVASRQRRYGPFDYDAEGELDRLLEYRARLLSGHGMVVDGVRFIHSALAQGKRILVEGANALMLDIDYGTYPYVTSSPTTISGVLAGLAIPPARIGQVHGVVKAYTTRVGGGPFPTELDGHPVGTHLQTVGHEVGVTTGRARRCGWLDAVILAYSAYINGYTTINLTKLDVLGGLETLKIGVAYEWDGKEGEEELPVTVQSPYFPADLSKLERAHVRYESWPGWTEDISNCTSYADLPKAARDYVERIQELIGVPIEWIGVGPGRDAMIRLE
ncbi:MAG: putative ADE12-adenylosuccinate synthetase [Piptocephalis tieghemiana]|nr:MAG: putative ADE12-adenylosuccinate synthetase [Piptocephalis tieghemiana]